MSHRYLAEAITPHVAAQQTRYYGRAQTIAGAPVRDELGEVEREFIAQRDSFYVATVSETGWPYMQHRGGSRGFLRVLGPNLLGFADFRGNRQMLSTGNLQGNNRVALFLMDYPRRSRLKIMGHAKVIPANEAPEMAAQLDVGGQAAAERVVTIDVIGFDWNCPKHITPRYTMNEVEEAITPLRARISELENRVRELGGTI